MKNMKKTALRKFSRINGHSRNEFATTMCPSPSSKPIDETIKVIHEAREWPSVPSHKIRSSSSLNRPASMNNLPSSPVMSTIPSPTDTQVGFPLDPAVWDEDQPFLNSSQNDETPIVADTYHDSE